MRKLIDTSERDGKRPIRGYKWEIKTLARLWKRTYRGIVDEPRAVHPGFVDGTVDGDLAELWPVGGMSITQMLNLQLIMLRAVALLQGEIDCEIGEYKLHGIKIKGEEEVETPKEVS